MKRPRSLARWDSQYSYEGVQQFLSSDIHDGVHSVKYAGTHLDLLVENAESDVTFVSFHAALSPRARTVPSLQGASVAKDVGVNLIAVSDPTLAKGDIDLGWFAGDKDTGPLPETLGSLIQHAAESLGTSRLILFGPSGGGYAAIVFGTMFPDSVVLAVNPRLDLNARPKAQLEKYLEVAHGDRVTGDVSVLLKEFGLTRVQDQLEKPLDFNLLIFQNSGDTVYLNNQLAPFLSDFRSDPRVHVRLENYATGHKPIPGEMLRDILRTLKQKNLSDAISQAGFVPTAGNPQFKAESRLS